MKPSKWILPVIVISQFCGTSLWFAGNGIMKSIVHEFHLSSNVLGPLTSSVQFGFIIGTLAFAIFTISDRFKPSVVFFISAILGGLFNLGIAIEGNTLFSLMVLRFLTGFFLAGIYPVGMKIASDYYKEGLGLSLSFLVGALVLGTAFPHLLNDLVGEFNWENVLYGTSGISLIGGILIVSIVGDGPHRVAGKGFDFAAWSRVFKNKKFRSAAFGYFGHMWELYAFWAFIPAVLALYQKEHSFYEIDTPLLSFLAIGIGFIGCITGGYISKALGVKKTATWALTISGLCCLISPLVFFSGSTPLLLIFLAIWGMAVIADSPLFSTMVAQNCDPEIRGTALTIVNCIGFAITIFSIMLLNQLTPEFNSYYLFTLLAIGPVFGVIGLLSKP